MKKRTHKPPSKIKYDLAHPTISVRVTHELYEELKQMQEQSGKSLGDILREALKKQAPSTKKAHQLGYEEAKAKYAVNYKCSVCGGNITVASTEEKEEIAKYMREHRWSHSQCIDKTAKPS